MGGWSSTRRALLKGGALAAGSVPVSRLRAATPAGAEAPAALASLLARNHEMSPEIGHGLSNHVSMGLFSLNALGGTAEQLRAFAALKWPALEPLPAVEGPEVTAANETAMRGRRDALRGWRKLFTREIGARGSAATLRRYVPTLLPGVGVGLFHPLIRTGYGLRFRNDTEVADGLSYWAIAYAELGPLPPPGDETDPVRVLAKVRESRAFAGRPLSGGNVFERMRAAAALPGFREVVGALKITAGTFRALASTAIKLQVATGDFTALHTVTAAHAFRQLLPFMGAEPRGIQYLWQAFVAAYVSMGTPSITLRDTGDVPAWDLIIKQAAASRDEHDLKLVDIAREEEASYGDPLYRRAAARRMRLR
jgi:hypothetical protein